MTTNQKITEGKSMDRIIVIIGSGVLLGVLSNGEDVKVKLIDIDNLKANGLKVKEINRKIRKYEQRYKEAKII